MMKKLHYSLFLVVLLSLLTFCESVSNKCNDSNCSDDENFSNSETEPLEKKEGFHITQLSQGERFEGLYKNGKRNGPGKYFFQDKHYLEGEWKENLLQGRAVIRNQKGSTVLEGVWLNNQYQGLYNPYSKVDQDKAN